MHGGALESMLSGLPGEREMFIGTTQERDDVVFAPAMLLLRAEEPKNGSRVSEALRATGARFEEVNDRMGVLDLFWLFIIASSLQPWVQQRLLTAQRARALRSLEKRQGSKVITLIHRREGLAILGFPFGGYLDIEDSEEVIRAIEMTSPHRPIGLVLHTPGGLVLAAEQIAAALAAHTAGVTVYVPHYAMSGGTLIALAADRIVMSPSAVLGPIDPQIGEYPVASILAAVAQKNRNEIDDRTLILADTGRKAQRQVEAFVAGLLAKRISPERARDAAHLLSQGRWTHDYPIDSEQARALGLPVSTELPDEVRLLIRLYPQPRARRPSVEYIPGS